MQRAVQLLLFRLQLDFEKTLFAVFPRGSRIKTQLEAFWGFFRWLIGFLCWVRSDRSGPRGRDQLLPSKAGKNFPFLFQKGLFLSFSPLAFQLSFLFSQPAGVNSAQQQPHTAEAPAPKQLRFLRNFSPPPRIKSSISQNWRFISPGAGRGASSRAGSAQTAPAAERIQLFLLRNPIFSTFPTKW